MPAVDIHPVNGLPMIEAGGGWRVLAALPGKSLYGCPAWWGARPVLPRSQWRSTSLRAKYPLPILDQGQTSSCVGHASAKAGRRAWLASGQQDHPFNPFWIYGLINGGRDAGASVGDAVDAMTRWGMACDGQLTDGDLPHHLYYPQQLQQLQQVAQKAQRFRILESWHLRGPGIFDQIGSALTLGYVVVSGIYVGRNFGQLDSDRVAPLPDQVLGGHALEHNGLVWLPRRNAWGIDTDNSWSAQWGANGTCVLVEGHWQSGLADAFAILATATDPQDASQEFPVAA